MKKLTCLLTLALMISTTVLASPTAGGETSYMTELSVGINVRSSVDSRSIDAPGPSLRLDFGRHLGAGFFLLGSLSWARLKGQKQTCFDCVQTESVNSLLTAIGIRYEFPFPVVTVYLQTGPGCIFDMVSQSGGLDGDPPMGFNQQLLFAGSLGLGFEPMKRLNVGIRADTLLGSNLNAYNFGGYAAVAF